MARVEKHYRLSEKNLEYIEAVKEKNNLKYSSEALDLIIREHESNSDITIDYIINKIVEKVSEQIRIDLRGIRKSSNESDINTQIILQLINGFLVKHDYKRLATTEDVLAPAMTNATDFVKSKREVEIKKAVYKR